MAGRKTYRLGKQQLKIMKVLWEMGEATVSEVQKKLDQKLAYTTVATMLRKMEERGLVKHYEQERRFVYQAAIRQEDAGRSLVEDLVDRVFSGDLASAVCHLLDSRKISNQDLQVLEQIIKERKKQRRKR